MHRHIDGSDVISYPSGAKEKSIDLLKDEDIEFRNGALYHSSGHTQLSIKQGQKTDTTERSLSEAFTAEGSFTLDLKHCSIPAKHVLGRRRRNVNEKMNRDTKEEDIKVSYDKCKN